jgi:hypothetical protein
MIWKRVSMQAAIMRPAPRMREFIMIPLIRMQSCSSRAKFQVKSITSSSMMMINRNVMGLKRLH